MIFQWHNWFIRLYKNKRREFPHTWSQDDHNVESSELFQQLEAGFRKRVQQVQLYILTCQVYIMHVCCHLIWSIAYRDTQYCFYCMDEVYVVILCISLIHKTTKRKLSIAIDSSLRNNKKIIYFSNCLWTYCLMCINFTKFNCKKCKSLRHLWFFCRLIKNRYKINIWVMGSIT